MRVGKRITELIVENYSNSSTDTRSKRPCCSTRAVVINGLGMIQNLLSQLGGYLGRIVVGIRNRRMGDPKVCSDGFQSSSTLADF